MVSLWESIQKFVLYWQIYLIKDLHNLQPLTKYIETTTFCKSFPLPHLRSMLMGLQITPMPCGGQTTDP